MASLVIGIIGKWSMQSVHNRTKVFCRRESTQIILAGRIHTCLHERHMGKKNFVWPYCGTGRGTCEALVVVVCDNLLRMTKCRVYYLSYYRGHDVRFRPRIQSEMTMSFPICIGQIKGLGFLYSCKKKKHCSFERFDQLCWHRSLALSHNLIQKALVIRWHPRSERGFSDFVEKIISQC